MTPKQLGFMMPAEWHPHSACWMAWPCHEETWSNIGFQRAYEAYARVANAIAQFEPVKMLIHHRDITNAALLCGPNIELIPFSYDDSWTRDTGCTFLINQQGQLGGVDWLHNAWGGNYTACGRDNKKAAYMLGRTHAQYFEAPLVMEGGSFHVDGEGTVLTSRECLLNPNRNPHLNQATIERYLHDYLGCETILWLNQGLLGDETDGHIDEIACFIEPGKVLALTTSDKDDPNYERLQENIALLNGFTDAKGRRLDVYTVEQPAPVYLDDERLTLSYINFYVANQGIVMPAFGQEKYDKAAHALLTELYPEHRIVQVDALDVFAGGGGIHCITQQQPSIQSR